MIQSSETLTADARLAEIAIGILKQDYQHVDRTIATLDEALTVITPCRG